MALSIARSSLGASRRRCHWSGSIQDSYSDASLSAAACSRSVAAATATRGAASAAADAASSPTARSATEAATCSPGPRSIFRHRYGLNSPRQLSSWSYNWRLVVYCFALIALVHSFSPGCAEQGGAGVLSTVEESRSGGEDCPRKAFEEGGDAATSLLEIIEERKKAWALAKAVGERKPQGIECSSAVYGQINADETVYVIPEEAPNCRSLCRALLHKHGGTCDGALDPYTCLMEHRSERWFPQVYRERCVFTRPSLQQPDFERSSCSEDCLRRGMAAWLRLLRRGDLSWEPFLEQVPYSCTFTRVDPERDRGSARAQTRFSESSSLRVLQKARTARYYIIHRRLNDPEVSAAEEAESTVVPAEYWEGLEVGERRGWSVANTFYAPADEKEVLPLVQRLTGKRIGQAICLFREQQDGGRGRFGMVPGRSCAGYIGVLYVLALENRPSLGFDGGSLGFDLCVSHRVLKDKVMADDAAIETLRIRTRVTVGTPCGVAGGLDKGLWGVAFFAARYPQARGIEGFPTGGDCPWPGALQLGAKCFLKTRGRRDGDAKNNFFAANAQCRSLAAAVGFDHDDASLAAIQNDMEFNLAGEMVSGVGDSWMGLFQPGQCPLVSPGVGATCRRKEEDCSEAALTSPDKLGNRLSAIVASCPAARTWPPWKPISAHSPPTWDPLFCDGHPQALDGEKFADCASLTQQGAGPPCLRARSCDASLAAVCSLRLRTGPRILSKGNRGARDVPLVLCSDAKNCWLTLKMPDADWWGETVERRPHKDQPFPPGYLALMRFCGTGSFLAGPWPVQPHINLVNDARLTELPAGVYEICYCSPVRVGGAAVSCGEGEQFTFLRGMLQLSNNEGTTRLGASPASGVGPVRTAGADVSSAAFKLLAGAGATEAAGVLLEALPSEFGPELVFCTVGEDRRTDSSCRFTLRSAADTEISVALSIVPVTEDAGDGAELCTLPGITVAVSVKGEAEVEVPSFLPRSLQYAICGNGFFLGTLIVSAMVKAGPDALSEGFSFAQSRWWNVQLRDLTLKFPDEKINNAFLEVVVEGFSSIDLAENVVLSVIEAETVQDTSCNQQLATTQADGGTYSGKFDEVQLLLTFTVPAPSVRSKLCLVNPVTEYFTDITSLGQAPLPTLPERVTAGEGRCSLASKGDCVIGLYPDASTIDQPWAAFYPQTVAVKLLKGMVECPSDPSDPVFEVFAGDVADTAALLQASALSMTLTHADSVKLMFSVEPKLKQWVANAEVATICMTQEGLKNPTQTCWENERCTQFLGYMRWTGPTAGYEQFFLCQRGQACDIEIRGKNMNFLSMHFSRLAALDACGKVSGEGSLPLSGALRGVDLSLPSDHSSFSQISAAGERVQEGEGAPTAADSAFLEVMDEPADEQVSATVFQEVRSTQLFSTTVHFDLNTSIDRDSLELCWNPSVGSVHHLLDHTVSVGRVLFLPWPSLQSVKLPPALFDSPVMAVTLQISARLVPPFLRGSTKVYLKRAPTDKDVDTCSFAEDAREGAITAYLSVSEAKETDDGQSLVTVVASVQQHTSSVCWVQFHTPSSFTEDSVQTTYLGRLPGLELPSSDIEATCSVDVAASCTATRALQFSSVLDANGQALQTLALLPPNTTVAAVPQDVCPSTPGEIDFTTPTNKQGISSEKLESSITGNSVTVTLDRNSRLLKKRGFAALCIVDNDCVDPVAKPCVKQLGTAKWKGPTASPYTEQLCEQLEAGRCRVTVAGFEMTSLDYGVPRLALSRSCGDANSTSWAVGENDGAEEGTATFLVPAEAGTGYQLCWNTKATPGSSKDADSDEFKANFNLAVSSISFLPFPIVKARRVSRRSPYSASVVVQVSALLDEKTAKEFGGRAPKQGLWCSISVDAFTDGSSCSSGSKLVTQPQAQVTFEKVMIRNRQDGSPVETGTDGTEATVAIMSFEMQAGKTPTTYCWTTMFSGGTSVPVRKSWTPLVSVSGPTPGHLGGSISNTAIALGFVPCMSGSTEASACIFGVTARPADDPALFPTNEPWILPEQSSVILLPGETECPSKGNSIYKSAVGLEASELSTNSPLSLSAEPISDGEVVEYATYRFGSARAWLSENGSATICWRDDGTGESIKIANVLWVGPLFKRKPIQLSCSHSGACPITVQGKNLTKLDHSFSRVAVLQKCGEARGLGTAQLRSAKVGGSSFLILGSHSSRGLLTENDLKPVNFWVLPRTIFHTRCKRGTTPEFVEARWVDTRGVCGEVDVADLLNAHCKGRRLCFFIPVARIPSESAGGKNAALQVSVPDTCEDTSSRKLFGVYRCVDDTTSSTNGENGSVGELEEGLVMVELSTKIQVRDTAIEDEAAGSGHESGTKLRLQAYKKRGPKLSPEPGPVALLQLQEPEQGLESPSDRNSSTSNESSSVSDESISFWAPQGSPGLYEICWNPHISPNHDPSAYSESLGIIEVFPVLSIVDEAVVCSGTELSTCTLQVTVGAQETIDDGQSFGLLLEDQDGAATCGKLTEEQWDAVVLPHQSSWSGASYLTELTYSTQLPTESRKLCIVAVSANIKTFGTPQYVGNVPGPSAPTELPGGEAVCLNGDTEHCHVKVAPEDASKYYILDNRIPDEDETSPSFDAFANLKPHLEPDSSVYAFQGDVACPESQSDERYLKATTVPADGVTKLALSASEIDGLTFRFTDEQTAWLTSSTGVTLCWALPLCSEDPLKNGSRPCTKRLGTLTWAGPVVQKPLPTVRCRLGQPCAFVVVGTKLAAMNHEISRVAFVKSCGSSEGPGIGIVTEFPRGYTSASSEGSWVSGSSFAELKSRRTRRGSSYLRGREKRLPRLEDRMLSLLQQDDQELFSVDSMTVISALPVDDSLAVCWNPLRTPTDQLEDFTLEIGKAFGYGISEITAFCTSGSVCGVDVTTKGSFPVDGVLNIRAFKEFCGYESAAALELPDGGQFKFLSGTIYTFSSAIGMKEPELITYELCWCDEQSTPECNVTNYIERVGSLQVQSMQQLQVICIKDASSICRITLPASMERDSLLYISKMTSSSPATCTTPYYPLPTGRGVVSGDKLEISVAFSSLEATGLVDLPLAICWTQNSDATKSIPEWSSSFIGTLIFVDPHASANTTFAGVPPIIRVDVTGLTSEQKTEDGLPLPLQQLYLKDKGTCASSTSSVAFPLSVQSVEAVKGGTGLQITFGTSDLIPIVLQEVETSVRELSLCWCYNDSMCVNSEDFDSELSRVAFRAPASGVSHECTYDTTCSLGIKDIPMTEFASFLPQLLIRPDCAVDSADDGLPDGGTMALRLTTEKPTPTDGDSGSPFEDHMYGFRSLVNRERALGGMQQVQKMICYCTDSTACTPDRLVNIGTLTITDVWNTEFRVSLVQPIQLPFTVHSPLKQQDSQRRLLVTRGENSLPCVLEQQADICTVNFQDFPADTLTSPDPATLQYYDSSLPQDTVDTRPVPYVAIASLVPAGPWKADYAFTCVVGGNCEVTIDVVNWNAEDKVALLSRCGHGGTGEVGFNQTSEGADGSSTSVVFRWTSRLELSASQMETGLELCWKAVEDALFPLGSISDYTAKFGTVSIAGVFPNQDASCYVGQRCIVKNLKAQNLSNGTHVAVLDGGCGQDGVEWSLAPNGGLMVTDTVNPKKITVSFPGRLPVMDTGSLVMCGCSERECTTLQDYGWRIGELSIKGPTSHAPHLEVFATSDIRLSLSGDFDDMFYLLLKEGVSCTAGRADPSWNLQGFSPITEGKAAWAPFNTGVGPLSICICHDKVTGLSDPFGNPSEVPTTCEKASNYAVKVGQVFVNGPVKHDTKFTCRSGSVCTIKIRYIAMDSEATREQWAKSQVYTQNEDCSIAGTVLLSGGDYISDSRVGEQTESTDPDYPIIYEIRESAFMFHDLVDLGAGTHNLCWKQAGATTGVTLGTFTIEGPLLAQDTIPVIIGKRFSVEVPTNSIIPDEEAANYRIRAYAYKGSDIFRNFSCGQQAEDDTAPAVFGCSPATGPPTAVKNSEAGSILIWEDVCVIVDELYTEAVAGDKYGICFCDGNLLGCDTADRYQLLVQAWELSGPRPLEQDVLPRYRAGVRFSLSIEGVKLIDDPAIMLSPAFDPLTSTRFTCQSDGKPEMRKFVGTVAADRALATFTDVYVPFTISQGLFCWCPGGDCSTANEFTVQLGRFGVTGPTFIAPRIVVGSYFTVQLIGPSLETNDAISIRGPTDICGDPGTENMDPGIVMEETNRTLNSLGTVESFSVSENSVSGEPEMTWTSWGIRIKATVQGYMKICYCPSTEQECESSGGKLVLAGLLETRGPSKGDIELVASDEYGEYLIVRGTNLSTRNLLRYFQYTPLEGTTTAEQEADICSNSLNLSGGVTTFPDAINAAGTEQYFSVTVSVGKQYAACWSFGDAVESRATSMSRSRVAPSFISADDLVSVRRSLIENSSTSSEGAVSDQFTITPSDDQSSLTPEARKWFFVSLFSQTGFQQGVHNVVLGHEDTVVISGVINATDTYEVALGLNRDMSECSQIFNSRKFRSDIGVTTVSVSESRMVLQMDAAKEQGWHKICVKNKTASLVFDAGTVEVTTYFQKSGMDMYDTQRTFVLPCLTGTKNSFKEQVREFPQVWLPDGTGLWTARVVVGVPRTEKEYSRLQVNSSPKENFIEFPQLRNVLACDTTKDQVVLVLGATHMLMLYPDSERPPDVINHGVPYPADLAHAGNQVFITSFDSHLITSFSIANPSKIIFYEPTNPTLLSAGGIQAIANIDGSETSIFVADTVGGIIGRLKILPDDLDKTQHGGKITREWTAVFGKQKSDFRNTEGVNRPFCLAEFVTPYSTQENMNSLLVVGELISDRITFLSIDNMGISFYRQITLGVTKFITGLRIIDEVLLLTSKQWSVEQELGRAEVAYITLSQLIDNVYFTYPDFSKKLQAGLRYRFLPLVTGQEIQFFKEDAEAGDPLQSIGFTLDSKTGEIQGTLTATVTSRVVIVGGDLLGSYTWSFEFEAGCQSGEYFNEASNKCEPCPLGTFRDEETELQRCQDHKAYSTTLQTGSTNLSQCTCIEGYEIGLLGYCQPCPAGTYKAIAADAKCTGRCPQHMYSGKTGAASLEDLNCQCEPGFYLSENGCESCQVGTYCEGDLSPPVQCPAFETTSSSASSKFSDCVCIAGYYREGDECVPCDVLTYKPLIGDQGCTQCPQPALSVVASSELLATSAPGTSMFSSRRGSTQQSECEVCASGYYFDAVSMGGCVPCKEDFYCPGFQLGMIACKGLSITAGVGAESVLQCKCPKGYGKVASRNPLDLSLACMPCPVNYFQHMDGSEAECMPCPSNSMTKSTKSSSITSCVALPGYGALENLQALSHRVERSDTDDSSTNTFLEAIELAKDVEKAYESLYAEDLLAINVFCKEDISSVQEYDMAEFVTMQYALSFAECQAACLKNVYCTSFSFSKEDRFPTHTNTVMNYTGIYFYSFWPCHLYMFGSAAAADVENWKDTWEGTDVEPGKGVACVVGRVKDELTWQRFRYVECPQNAYCPGDKDASIFECQDYAVTLSTGAYSREHCLCVPGREPVGHMCEQCKLGFYKNATENIACTECPQFFTTSITASTSAYECTCQAGMYMAPPGTTEETEQTDKIDQPEQMGPTEQTDGALEPPSPAALEPAALQTIVHARSIRELGRHGEMEPVSPGGTSMLQLGQLPWLEEETREQLEKVVELGVCVPCHTGMFCPGHWKDPPTNSTHMPPQQCIEGSSVPQSTVNADSVEKCLCLAGYAYGRSSDAAVTSDSYFTCSKCPPGTYKELQENSPCSGRCMKDAETYPGAMSKSQCFCQVGRYAVETDDSEGMFSCVECITGGVCVGGFKQSVIKAIEENPSYTNITIADHTTPYPQKGWFATFKTNADEPWRPNWLAFTADSSNQTSGVFDLTTAADENGGTAFLQNTQYDRVPDIHPCPVDYRCHGGPSNACAEGGSGYLCSTCKRGYDISTHGGVCTKCQPIWFEIAYLITSRLVLCVIAWLIAAISCLAVRNPACIHPILIRIWLSNLFVFFLFGFFPENSVSALVDWAPMYRAMFTYPIFIFNKYPKVFCILDELGFPLDFKKSWYLQRFAQMLVPVLDVCITTVICGIALILYKLYRRSKIQRVSLVLSHAQEVHASDIWAMRTVEKIEDMRCLGLFHYISPAGATRSQKILRFFGDLVPAFMVIWFWNLPFLVIECTQLLGCVSIAYKDEPAMYFLTALPEQECSLSEPWFVAGAILGSIGILVWGIGSVIVFCVWMLYTDNADKLEARFRYGFLSNGYEFQYRAWEMFLMARKLACACLLTLQLHMSASGTQEVFRNSVNLLIVTMCLIIQLLIEPYDRRSHNLTNRVEFMGLLTNVINCIIIQGSFSFPIFSWLGPLPIILCGLFHLYVLWNLFVEAGRMVLMRPHLARLPSPWRYFNLVTRSLARLYTRGHAKVYYNYITSEMVLEAAAKSRVFHIRRMIQRKKKLTDYRKINYENRTYFVSALTDSLSRLVISWCQFTIPGDWLDFTIRYAFCYCFWMRHRAASNREPLDLEEFDAMRPSLFNECYVETEDGDDDGALDPETQCNEVEEEFLDMLVDDDVYDDSPITLMELYVAVQSMRYIPKGQLRRLHVWYRERMAAASSSDMPALRKENEELEAELQQLSEVLRNRFGSPGGDTVSFNILDFFFAVEILHEAEAENSRIRRDIDKEIASIMNARAARSVAERVQMELEKTDGEELEDILRSFDEAAERTTEAKARLEYLEEAVGDSKRKVKSRRKASKELSKKRVVVGSRRLSIAEERRRILRPTISNLDAGGTRKSLSPIVIEKFSGGRTISPVGSGDGSGRRRISVSDADNGKSRRISLSPLPGSASEGRRLGVRTLQSHSISSDSVDSSVSGRRTVRSASRSLSSDHLSSGEDENRAPKRTARMASPPEPVVPAEGQPSFGQQESRRRVMRVGSSASSESTQAGTNAGATEAAPKRAIGTTRSQSTEPLEGTHPSAESESPAPTAKRSIGLFKRPPGPKEDKP